MVARWQCGLIGWLGLICLIIAVQADNLPSLDNGVYVLSESNFDEFVSSHKHVLVEFYAPWCGHCKNLAPEYEDAAKELKKGSLAVRLAKVDATVEVALGTKFDVKGYPTIKFFVDGVPTDYDGPRDGPGIVNWVKEKADPNYKPPPEAVVTLAQDNFTDFIAQKDLVLVEFYAPWCGHCKQLAPKYEKAARRLKLQDPPILLAKVDATESKDLAKDHGVSGYPTLKVFRAGKRYDYNGPRDEDGIVSYMKEQGRPAAQLVTDKGHFKRFISQTDVTVLGLFPDEHSKLYKNFIEAAEAGREEFKSCAYSFDGELRKKYKLDGSEGFEEGVILFQPEKFWSKYEPKYKVLERKGASPEDIYNFMKESAVPLVGQRNTGTEERYSVKRPLVVVYYTVDFSHAGREGTQYWRQKVLEVAKDHTPTYTFAIADEDEYADDLQAVGLGESGQEVNVIAFGKDGRKYPMHDDDDFSLEAFKDFMKKLNTGRIKPFIKSQPIPASDTGPVKVVVAKNFDKIVMDESKDVLIELYAPWCGHCKSLAPKYEQLAKKLSKDKRLVIAKMDATANDAPEKYSAEGFPTIYYAPVGKKEEPIAYTGDRSPKDLEKFMRDNAVVSFKQKEEL